MARTDVGPFMASINEENVAEIQYGSANLEQGHLVLRRKSNSVHALFRSVEFTEVVDPRDLEAF